MRQAGGILCFGYGVYGTYSQLEVDGSDAREHY